MTEQPLGWSVRVLRPGHRGQLLASLALGTQRRRLLTGCLLLAMVATGGLYFAFFPSSTPLDRLAEWILPDEWSNAPLVDVVSRVLPPLLVVTAVCSCAFSLFRDRRRAITCIAAPLVAWAISEHIVKPLVGRTIRGSLCYPSGHMTTTAAVIAAAVLVVPPGVRKLAVITGVAVGAAVAASLILLRWHYLTDELAGVAVGIGTVLVIDASLHLLSKGSPVHALRPVSDRWESH